MKINNNWYVNFQGTKQKVQNEQENTNLEQKKIQASANNAFGNYGKAFVNISFRGNIQNSKPITPEIKELTDEEFKEYKAKLDEKIKSLPDNVQEEAKEWRLNKWNIFATDKLLSDERLYGNEKFMKNTGK